MSNTNLVLAGLCLAAALGLFAALVAGVAAEWRRAGRAEREEA